MDKLLLSPTEAAAHLGIGRSKVLRADAARPAAIGEDRRVAAYPTSSTRRLYRSSCRGAAVTSPRGRGKDSVHLHGDRWRGPHPLVRPRRHQIERE